MNADAPGESEELRRARLRALAARHGVVFEVRRAQVPCVSGLRVIGYDVYLVGRHSEPMLRPGCTKCQSIWVDLGALAHAALPRAERRTRFSIRPFDHALHFAAAEAPAQVELVIEVRHRTDYAHALDDCEEVCLARLLGNLRALGITESRAGQHLGSSR